MSNWRYVLCKRERSVSWTHGTLGSSCADAVQAISTKAMAARAAQLRCLQALFSTLVSILAAVPVKILRWSLRRRAINWFGEGARVRGHRPTDNGPYGTWPDRCDGLEHTADQRLRTALQVYEKLFMLLNQLANGRLFAEPCGLLGADQRACKFDYTAVATDTYV